MKGKPYLDAVEFYFIVDATTRLASFQAGELDELIDPTVAQVQELKKNPGKYVLWDLPAGLTSYGLGPDAANPNSPFAKLQVRQAVAYAIDRKTMVDNVLGGFASVSTQLNLPGAWSYNPALPGYPYDVAKAKQLLANAGYPNGFETAVVASSGTGSEVLISTALQGMLAKVNIKLNLNLQAAAALQQSKAGGWSGMGLTTSPASSSMVSYTLSLQLRSTSRTSWVSLLKSPTIDAAVNDAFASPDMAAYQTRIWKVMDLVYYKEVQLIPVVFYDQLLAKYPYVKSDNIFMSLENKNSGQENCWLDR